MWRGLTSSRAAFQVAKSADPFLWASDDFLLMLFVLDNGSSLGNFFFAFVFVVCFFSVFDFLWLR